MPTTTQPTLQSIASSIDQVRRVQDTQFARLNKDMNGVKKDIGGLKQDVGGLKKDVGGLKQDVGGLKKDFGILKKDVRSLKTTVNKIEKEQKEDSIRLTVLQVDISEMREINERTEEKVDKTLTQLDNLVVTKVLTYDAEHAAHRHAQARHEGRIAALEVKKQKQSS
jgi:chromosome segregation ATPase